MHTLATSLAVGLLLGTSLGSPAMGGSVPEERDATAGPASAAQRIEVPAHGFAFTLPGGWMWEAYDYYLGRAPFAGVFAESPSGNARCQARASNAHVWYSPEDPDAGLERLIHSEVAGRGDPPEPVVVNMPAGPAIRIDDLMTKATTTDSWLASTRPWRGEDKIRYAHGTSYLILAPDGTASVRLDCQRPYSKGARRDRWLSLAESVEFLPGGPAGGPSPARRVEVPGLGVAISFPDDWIVELLHGGADAGTPVLVPPGWLGPDVAIHDVVVSATAPDIDARGVTEGCALALYQPTDVTPTEFMDLAFGRQEAVDALGGALPAGRHRVSLMAAETVADGMRRIRIEDSTQPFTEQYAIESEGTIASLWCRGPWSFGDRWLPIAETMEFLSEE
jgi:hypothetical protein